MKKSSLLLENIRQALTSIRANALRASLTIMIIAFGILAIVGVLTAIDGIKYYFSTAFSNLGSNTYKIQNREPNISFGGNNQQKRMVPITLAQAQQFKEVMDNRAVIGINAFGAWGQTVRYQGNTTNPNVNVRGSDENFMVTEGYEIAEGRSFNAQDVAEGRDIAVIGYELKTKLFPNTTPIGKYIVVGKKRYRIIGLLKEKGSAFGSDNDRRVVVPITTMLRDFPQDNRSFVISVYVDDPAKLPAAESEGEGQFRLIRKLKPGKPNNFAFFKSDGLVEQIMQNLQLLTASATAISIITLFGASIGLMNIMLVSVTERTREIGVRKALGASSQSILTQFLVEAITISILGGILGVILGLLMGNLIGLLLGSGFIFPVLYVMMGLVVCFVVGIASGIYPARRAAALDPIDALRYE